MRAASESCREVPSVPADPQGGHIPVLGVPPPRAAPAPGRQKRGAAPLPTSLSQPGKKGSSLEAGGWQWIRSWVMSCKGKSPKGVRGGRVSWGEQMMTPAWSSDPSQQPGGLGVPCLGQGSLLGSSALQPSPCHRPSGRPWASLSFLGRVSQAKPEHQNVMVLLGFFLSQPLRTIP